MFANAPGNADQGSVVDTTAFSDLCAGSVAVIITPRCELEHKAEFVTLAAVCPIDEVARRLGWGTESQLRNRLSNILKNQEYRWHYLTAFGLFNHGAIVDFQLVTSADVSLLDDVDVIATLRDGFREQLAQRYAAYVGRVGTDDLVKQEELQAYRNEIISGVLEELRATNSGA